MDKDKESLIPNTYSSQKTCRRAYSKGAQYKVLVQPVRYHTRSKEFSREWLPSSQMAQLSAGADAYRKDTIQKLQLTGNQRSKACVGCRGTIQVQPYGRTSVKKCRYTVTHSN